ncbi:relaxase/mobilization nuclease domain-containing protein [Streptomyces sp. P38-E01]|uniref:Relaxase/mobilization nuclease domain-containing protein n=1 Tax=Streptomyces tardus TaxID=2780544 RepID=A0A949JF29_9ACTN|nr:relaxase/mobilization nuclease domain-containing protein [Streptomyces tardus]MBU7597390.1 relaxase/mobilization nuclease domain-containing protein [Streptomyces tardus]
MIAKISSGKNTAGLIRYLYGPGRANEHTNPHLVASWDGYAPDPAHSVTPAEAAATRKLLVADLDLHVNQAKRHHRTPTQHVWHCSLRTAPGDRTLTDDEWSHIAHRIVAATGIAPEGDPDGCRWIAVRHAPDHIHIAATTVRPDLRTARHWNDYLTADRELATIEKEYGLHQVARSDRTAAKRPTRAEHEKAHRTGRDRTARERLRTTVRTAVAAATTTEEFVRLLHDTDGVLVEVQHFPSGDIRGYKVALPGDVNAAGEPVWFSGCKLAPDLSFPKIRERLNVTEVPELNGKPHPWHLATAAAESIPRSLEQNDDNASQAHLATLGEALDALPLIAPSSLRLNLHQAATTFERATRSHIRPDHQSSRALRAAVRAILREPTPRDGTALAMFLDAIVLAVIAAVRWHDKHHNRQQALAAQQALTPLQTAYNEAAKAPLTSLANRKPPRAAERHSEVIRETLPEHADDILTSSDWGALATVLSDAKVAGHDPARLLKHAADQRALDDTRSPARVLVWRIERLRQHPASSARTRAAQARSSTATHFAPHPQAAAPISLPAERPLGRRRR